MRPLARFSSLLVLLLLPSVVFGTSYLVRPDGTGAFPTIGAAVSAAVTGDTILLADGTFTGAGNRSISFAGKAIVIKSQNNDPTMCIIDCESWGQGFRFVSGEGGGSVLQAIEIHDAIGTEGGGVVVISASPRIINCRFTNCRATHGAGLYARSAHSLLLTDCVFIDNAAGDVGGGLMMKTSSSPQVFNCVFARNSSNQGAGIGCWEGNSIPWIKGCVFFDNVASSYGGGILAKESRPSIEDCTIAFNRSGAGGGICVYDSGAPTIRTSIVAFAGSGAAVYCFGSGSATVVCTDIYGNSGGDWTGCIATQAGAYGNLSEDPLFCSAETWDLALQEASPCADAPTCGLLGALGVGCGGGQLAISTSAPSCPLSSADQHQEYPQGTAFSATGGVPPYVWSQAGLPAGMGIDAATGEVEGIPEHAGTFSFTVTVTDQASSTAQRECSIDVESDLAVSDADPACPIPDGIPAVAYPAGTVFSAAGGTPPYAWSQTDLPSGLDIHAATGEIFGTTLLTGTFAFTVVVQDADGSTAGRSCSVSILNEEFVLAATDSVGVVGYPLSLGVRGYLGGPIRAFSVAAHFDPSVFALDPERIDTSGTASAGARIVVSGSTDSTVQIGVIYSFGCPPEIGAGDHLLVKLLLRVKQDAPTGPTVVQLIDLPPALNRVTTCLGVDAAPALMSGTVVIYSESLIRSDVTGDGTVNIADPLVNLAYQFQGASVACLDAADVDDNGVITISDPSYSLNHQFGGGSPPPLPFPECYADATIDELGCECHTFCMGCRPSPVPVLPAATASVFLDVGPWVPEGGGVYAYPVLLSTNEPLWGFEFRAVYASAALRFESVTAPGFDYASAEADSSAGTLHAGLVPRIDLSVPIEPGIHEVGRLRLHASSPPGPGSLRLTEGVFVEEGGASGPANIGTVTGVDPGEENVPGSRGFWSQASPNPFNPSVTIRYGTPGSCDVEIRVFDALGRRVKTLVAGSREVGSHEVLWDGTGDGRASVPSGVYFCTVRACGWESIHKLILLR